jgi:DNA-directed RNA polymerase specialized sigma24 family protein
MIAPPKCNCLICRLETTLITELSAQGNHTYYRQLVDPSLVLSAFPTAVELIHHLHRPEPGDQHSFSDPILLGIDPLLRQLWHSVLLLVFIPTIHRTTSQLSAIFPSLARDDIAQHLITVLLEFLRSQELQSRRSHLAFTIARKIRRAAFRWAIRESRIEAVGEPNRLPTLPLSLDGPEIHLHSAAVLQQFLDDCERKGWLTSTERQILTDSKIGGMSCRELSRRNGHSTVAVQHRIHRLINRLRRLARPSIVPKQLELFRSEIYPIRGSDHERQ